MKSKEPQVDVKVTVYSGRSTCIVCMCVDHLDLVCLAGFISHAKVDMSVSDSVVRCVLFSPKWTLRLNYLHHFLATNLSPYAAECSAFYPPQELLQVSSIVGTA